MGIESSQLHQSVRMHRNTKSPKKMLYRVRLRQTSSDQLIFNLWQESIDHPTTDTLFPPDINRFWTHPEKIGGSSLS